MLFTVFCVCVQVARYAYKARKTDELSFGHGQRIVVLQQPAGGWEGQVGQATGWFPCTFVTLQQHEPTPPPVPMDPLPTDFQERLDKV